MAASKNHFALEFNEKEIIELLEYTTQGKNLKTLFQQLKHLC